VGDGGVLKIVRRISQVGAAWLAGDWPSMGGVLNITAAAWTAGLQWWHSGDIRRTQNVSEYMLVLAVCLVIHFDVKSNLALTRNINCQCIEPLSL